MYAVQWLLSRNSSLVLETEELTRCIDLYLAPIPMLPPPADSTAYPDPIHWLRRNGDKGDHQSALSQDGQPRHKRVGYDYLSTSGGDGNGRRPRAALIALVSSDGGSELGDLLASMGHLEAAFNSRHGYDWVFFSAADLGEEFKRATSNATNANCLFERIPPQHWGTPAWIDGVRLEVGLEREFGGSLHAALARPDLESYSHACRWNAGLFAWERRLLDYDWFWRIQPGVSTISRLKTSICVSARFANMPKVSTHL